MALGFFIQIGLQENYQQAVEQQSFRRALYAARLEGENTESQSVTYQEYRDRLTPDPTQGFGIMPRTSTQGSSVVTWGEWLTFIDGKDRNELPRTIVDLNETVEDDFRSEDFIDNTPFIQQIKITSTGNGNISSSNASSSRNSTMTHDTVMKLNVNGTAKTNSMQSTITSNMDLNM